MWPGLSYPALDLQHLVLRQLSSAYGQETQEELDPSDQTMSCIPVSLFEDTGNQSFLRLQVSLILF